jgi:hypothetical protein
MFFFIFKHWFCWKYQSNKFFCLIFSPFTVLFKFPSVIFAITSTSTSAEFLPQVSSFKYNSQSEKQITTTEHITAGGMGGLLFFFNLDNLKWCNHTSFKFWTEREKFTWWRMLGHDWRIYNYIRLPTNTCSIQPAEQQDVDVLVMANITLGNFPVAPRRIGVPC